MASILCKHAVVDVLDDFHQNALCYRNQSPCRHLSVRLSRGKTSQRILGGRLWWRLSANIFGLVGVKPPTFSFGCNHGSALTALVLLYWSVGRQIHLSIITSWQLQENIMQLLRYTGPASNMTEKCGPVLHYIQFLKGQGNSNSSSESASGVHWTCNVHLNAFVTWETWKKQRCDELS